MGKWPPIVQFCQSAITQTASSVDDEGKKTKQFKTSLKSNKCKMENWEKKDKK